MSKWKSKEKEQRDIKGERGNVREVDWSGDLLPFLMNWKIDKKHETGKNLLNLIHQEKELPWLHQSQNLVFLKVEHFYQNNPRSHATWKYLLVLLLNNQSSEELNVPFTCSK